MTPSEEAKSLGLKNLKEITVHTDVSMQTLQNWHKHKHRLFKTVAVGVVELVKQTKMAENQRALAKLRALKQI